MNNNHPTELPTLLTVRQCVERHPFLTSGGLRHLIFHAEENGFARCIRRVGRRVYIVENELFQFIEEQNGGHAA